MSPIRPRFTGVDRSWLELRAVAAETEVEGGEMWMGFTTFCPSEPVDTIVTMRCMLWLLFLDRYFFRRPSQLTVSVRGVLIMYYFHFKI
jgi:MFS superfamily sulfate permease-like transporter